MRILLVEDDEHLAQVLTETLESFGHTPINVFRGLDAISAAREAEFVLLDLGLPDLDGQEICRRIRAISRVPIIVVSARANEIDRVILLRSGADDYLVKPYSTQELLARIEAVGRRANSVDPTSARDSATLDSECWHLGPLRVDAKARVVHVNDREVSLTRREFDLLAALCTEPDTVRRREDLMSEVWDENWFGSTRTLDVHIGSLRSKLGHRDWIRAVRGVGFRLSTPDLYKSAQPSISGE